MTPTNSKPMKTQQTETAIDKEQQRETARSIHRQAVELQHTQGLSYAQGKAKATQPTHSPLPWDFDTDDLATWINSASIAQPIAKMGSSTALPIKANAAYIVRACNNAERLAEALANLARPLTEGWKVSDMDVRIKEANEALAQWEAGL